MKPTYMDAEQTENEIDLFVPGRLCLFGEHSDWAGHFTEINSDVIAGKAIVTGIDLGIYASAKKSEMFKISSIDTKGNRVHFECEMNLGALKSETSSNSFFSYACGVATYLAEDYNVGGVEIEVYKVTLPMKKGLSSSAAICVLVARAFNELYKLNLSTNGEMNVAYRGEMLTSSRCGRLDQACAYGICPVCMDFNGDRINVDKLKVGKDLYWVFADLMSKKNTKKILSDLNKCYPFAQNELAENVHSALGVENHRIILSASEAIAEGNAKEVGRIMAEAQQLFDEKIAPACPDELTAPKLHRILNDARVKELSYGGKGVGSQGDGTVQFIARDKESQQILVTYLNDVLGLEAYPFTLPSRERIKRAIIPVAGFGTRMYPETHFIKKAFLPVIDENDIVKPVIMYLLEELIDAGIDEVILIVGEDEVDDFNKIFEHHLDSEQIEKLPKKVRGYEKQLKRISGKIKYAVQKERKGFGHAVYQARQYLSETEPVILLLGDFIYKSNILSSCTQQTMNAYNEGEGQAVVAIKPVDAEDVVHYGILTGEFDKTRNHLMHVTDMSEKPSMHYAKNNLGVKKDNITHFYATFGQYVLTPDIFDYLEKEIAESEAAGSNEEISLTNALANACSERGMTGVLVNGTSYDVGIPKAYRETINNYSK